MIKDSFNVHWRMPDPPVQTKEWVPLKLSAKGEALSVERILQAAFAKGLARNVGWQIAENENKALYVEAGKIFRRGVAVHTDPKALIVKSLSGNYTIDFCIPQNASEIFGKAEAAHLHIIDKNVFSAWPELKALTNKFILPMTEIEKNLSTMQAIRQESRKHKKIKKWVIVGGGLVSDTAGFAAAMEGVAMQFVPTTLLAMADACVGGKTGVNFPPYGKNQIGRFYFPDNVAIWTGWLETLPERERRAGLSECLKHAFLMGDKPLCAQLQKYAAELTQLPLESLRKVIQLKADVVAEDPSEIGKRSILNFGHTLGHALEALSQEQNPKNYLLHGEAVAIGMAFASYLSTKVCALAREDYQFIIDTLRASGCLISLKKLKEYLCVNDLSAPEIWQKITSLLLQDKKNTDKGKVSWVLLRGWGDVYCDHGKYAFRAKIGKVEKHWQEWLGTEG